MAWSAPEGPWKGSGIAIVGMAGRFPMAPSVAAFWQNLLDGRDCIARLTREELLANGVAPQSIDDQRFVPAGAVLDDIDRFDAPFFGVSPREAESMDPQQRLFLEVVQHAFDDAGLDPARAAGPIGVYAGERLSDYWLRLLRSPRFMAKLGWHQVAAGNDKDFLPAQASFRFDLRGPSVNVQSACSTSLLAVSLAADALLAGRCDAAVAGAASVAVPQRTGYMHAPSSIASADGRCRPFDAKASGSVLGNGVAAVVLKRVEDAIAAGDRIYAVLRAVAVNNDGATKSSFAGPSVAQQADVIARAIADAGVAARDIGYVEAHGTATALGDPIEVAALARTVGAASGRAAPCLLGSVKSNVGHLDPVAGAAALIKTALSLYHGEIPPSLHFETPNPAIDFAATGIEVVAAPRPWPPGPAPRLAGVSAFGIGGTNVHAVVTEAPAVAAPAEAARPELVVVSARTETALAAMSAALAERLAAADAPALAGAAQTLACGRRVFAQRTAVVAGTADEAVAALARAGAGRRAARDPRVVFLHPGQGRQRLGMGLALYRGERVFREAIDEIAGLAAPRLGFDLRSLIDRQGFGNGHDRGVTDTALAQPLLFAISVATARLWAHWGVRPDTQLGHSVGELAAAHLARVISLPDAVRLVVERGRLMQGMPPGAMLAASLDEAAALALEDGEVQVAAFNGPREQVLSGSIAAIDALEARLSAAGTRFTRLGTSHAFHHRSMQGAADALLETLAEITLSPPERPFVSCVTGRPVTAAEATSPGYWADSIVRPVRFADAARTLLGEAGSVYLECGSGGVLGALMRSHGLGQGDTVVRSLAAPGERRSDHAAALAAAGQCWAAGASVRLEALWQGRPGRRVTLPGYAFERERYWIEPASDEAKAPEAAGAAMAANAFTRVWSPAPLASARPAGAACWLVLCDGDHRDDQGGGPGAALAERLRASGARAVTMRPAAADARPAAGPDDTCVDIASETALAQLAQDLALGPGPVHAVNAWPACLPLGALDAARVRRGAEIALAAPARLLRALKAAGCPAVALTTLTARLFPVGMGEAPDPAMAFALGLTRTLPQEVPGLVARIVDILPEPGAPWPGALLDALAAELLSAAAEPVVALRAGGRLVETFAPLALPAASAPMVARPGGTYLITGGFGGLGGVFAETLASVGGVRLALLGRRGLAEGDPAAAALVERLERAGATVAPFACDVADAAALDRVIGAVEARFGRIDGVVHAAGLPGGRMLMATDDGQGAAVIAPKAEGALALLNAVAAHRPDFVFLCSSFASVSGGMGQGEYAAANAFLDVLSMLARAGGMNSVAVSWPAWRDVGMAHAMALPDELKAMREASLAAGIGPAEGAELFLRLVRASTAHVVVAPRALAAAQAAAAASPPPAPTARQRAQSALHTAPPPLPCATTAAMVGDLDAALGAEIAEVWVDVLGVASVSPDDDFFELGGQSLVGLQVVMRLSERFAVELSLPDLFEYPSLGGFTALVRQRMEAAIAAMSEDEVRRELGEAVSP